MERYAGFKEMLREFSRQGRLRSLPSRDGIDPSLVDLTSNDYLGLAQRSPEFVPEFLELHAADLRHGYAFTSASSRLLCRHPESYEALEGFLQRHYGRPALFFNSGYHANVGLLQALADGDTVFVCDKLVHASMIDGIRLSGAEFTRFRHNDIGHLESTLAKLAARHPGKRLVVTVESVYSMDGDLCPLRELVGLRERFPQMLVYLDEAHGIGVMGAKGLGLAEATGTMEEVDILVGTFGKAVASEGAFAVMAPELREYMVNCARSLIFSTAVAPMNVWWTLLMLQKIVGMGAERELLVQIREEIAAGCGLRSQSQIVPWVIGDVSVTLEVSHALAERGVAALPIRKPTVPQGTERIRLSLNAALTGEQVSLIVNAVNDVASTFNLS